MRKRCRQSNFPIYGDNELYVRTTKTSRVCMKLQFYHAEKMSRNGIKLTSIDMTGRLTMNKFMCVARQLPSPHKRV